MLLLIQVDLWRKLEEIKSQDLEVSFDINLAADVLLDSFIDSFIHSGDLYSASSRDYYSEAQIYMDIFRDNILNFFRAQEGFNATT